MTTHTEYSFTAILTLLPTVNGGRRSPVYDNYRPSFSFSSKNYISGEISFPDHDLLAPGSTGLANIKLLPSKHIRQNLKSGDAFTILEGNKLVGTGVIQVILEQVRDIIIH